MFGYWITVSRTPISACFTVSKHTEQLNSPVPSLYVLNAAALTKPHAVEQLAADVGDIKVILPPLLRRTVKRNIRTVF